MTVNGRLLAGAQANHAGAITLIHDTITTPTCAPPATDAHPAHHDSSPADHSGVARHLDRPWYRPRLNRYRAPVHDGHGAPTGPGETAVRATPPRDHRSPTRRPDRSGPVTPALQVVVGAAVARTMAWRTLLLAGTLCVVGVARLAQRSNR